VLLTSEKGKSVVHEYPDSKASEIYKDIGKRLISKLNTKVPV